MTKQQKYLNSFTVFWLNYLQKRWEILNETCLMLPEGAPHRGMAWQVDPKVKHLEPPFTHKLFGV